jgi:hypothetical protein
VQQDIDRDLIPGILSAVVLVLAEVVLVGTIWLMLHSTPTFRQLAADMGARTPALTAFFLDAPKPLFPAVLGVIAAGLLLKELLLRPRVRLWINIAALPAALLFAGLYVASLYLPMLSVLQQVQQR